LPPPAPPNLVFIGIALFVAVAVRLLATLAVVAIVLPPLPFLLPATLIVISIALAALAFALFVTLQPCCHCHCPRVTVADAIALDVVTCPPTLLPLPSLLPPLPFLVLLPATLVTNVNALFIAVAIDHPPFLLPSPPPSLLLLPSLACHPCCRCHCSCRHHIALFVAHHPHHHCHRPCRPHPCLSPTSLVSIAITHIVAITVAIALVTIDRLPPLLPLLLPPKPSLSLLHSTLVANDIALFVTLAVFITRHPYPHHHHQK
jgi:hypothetical protein